MTYTEAWLTNNAYGFPRGAERTVQPVALACVHVTDNPKTPIATAKAERDYANRADSPGPSAHDYINRDGSCIHAVPTKYAAWSNGAVRSPMTGIPGIPAVLAFRDKGRNVNEAYVREIENVGRPDDLPLTRYQIETMAFLIALDSMVWNLPIGRETVHTHAYIDSEQRSRCAWLPEQREAAMTSLIAKAKDIYAEYAPVLAMLTERTVRIGQLSAELGIAQQEVFSLRAELAKAQQQATLLAGERDSALKRLSAAQFEAQDIYDAAARQLAL